MLLLGCENDRLLNKVSFSGKVIDTDTADKVPLQGIQVDLLVQKSIGVDSILKSTITDSKGKYSFQVEDLDDYFQFYKVVISHEYYSGCFEPITPDMTISGHKSIKRTSVNIWNLNACVTGKVETTISKKSNLTKDTLSIVVSTRYPNNTYITDLNSITVTADTQWTKAYFYNVVRSVKYIIELKKENGEILSWTEEKELRPKEKIKFEIEF